MVQSGIQRAFGPDLHRFLATALSRRLGAFAAGLAVTALLQSSTATALMLTGLAATGAVALIPALAVMLGANVGTTLIVQVISFDVAAAAPALILIGVVLFRRAARSRPRDLGRVSIGLGLMLLALHHLLALVMPIEAIPGLGLVLDTLAGQPALAVLLAALLAWAAHSSVAAVLLIMSFAAKGLLGAPLACALVLGANLGAALNPVLEGAGDNPASRRLPLGNLALRAAGVLAALPFLAQIAGFLTAHAPSAALAVAFFHTGFNLVLALVFLPLLGPVAALLARLLPDRPAPDDPARPRYLDPASRAAAPLALAAASREALRMADHVEAMLRAAASALASADRRALAETSRLDDAVDALNHAILAYLRALDPEALSEADRRRLNEILVFVANLEAAADVLDHNLLAGAARRLKRGLAMAPDEAAEATRLLDRLAATLRAAAAVFMTEDARAARLLVAEKEAFRDLEAAATAARIGLPPSQPGTAAPPLHLDVLRDLKQVNAHLVAAAAYPVLAGQGDLLPSRLRA
jgi:phosphate:Na+ symporter